MRVKTDQLLALISWDVYENSVVEAARLAFLEYSREHSATPSDKVYSVSVFTDPQIQVTSISFETAHHAKWKFFARAGITDELELQEAVDEWDPYLYPTMLRSFKYDDVGVVDHPELSALNSIDFADHESEVAVLTKIESSLLHVVERIRQGGLLSALFAEDEIWICVNSPRDPFDNAVLVRIRDGDIVRTDAGQSVE